MKDKLRELVNECRKPYPEGAHGTRYADGYNDAGNDIADRLESILDAEGDGGAADGKYTDEQIEAIASELQATDDCLPSVKDCTTASDMLRSLLSERQQPVRGVVSDADVEASSCAVCHEPLDYNCACQDDYRCEHDARSER